MAKKADYSHENIRSLNWNEHIRLRPGMYLGSLDIRGFIEMMKGIISSIKTRTKTDDFSIELKDDLEIKIKFNNPKGIIENGWGQLNKKIVNKTPFMIEMPALNALSERFEICFLDSNNEKIDAQYFEQGNLIRGEKIDKISCSHVEIDAIMDKSIWGEEFKLNKTFVIHYLREFAYLHKRTKFEIKYKEGNEDCRVIYHFKNGLKDKIDIEIFNGLGGSYFETEIDEQIGDFHLEAAFAYRSYSVDPPFLKSFANDYFTYENGTHVDGLLKGLTYGVMKYFQKNKLTETYKISEKGMRENLVAAINIRLEAPFFSGCVRNKLANPEIIEPIANFIAELFLKKIEEDEEATKDLIRKFKI